MKRNIIKINKDRCNGCGLCIPNCPEGAIQMIDGKARVINEIACDGLGACIGHCPEGAIEIEQREAQSYDEKAVMDNIVKAGENTIKAHLKHLKDHDQTCYLQQAMEYLKENNVQILLDEKESIEKQPCGCPGMMEMELSKDEKTGEQKSSSAGSVASALRQWPVQLSLINSQAPYLKGADILIAADCTAFSFGDFHQRFIKGKICMVFCPKLDENLEDHIEKLTEIIKENNIKSITIVKMEVPCCNGTTRVIQEALKKTEKNILIKEYTLSLKGEII